MQPQLFSTTAVDIPLPDGELSLYEQFLPDSDRYFETLCGEVRWRQDTITVYGKSVLIPRLNAWYGDPGAVYSYSGLQLQPIPWTASLLRIKAHIEAYSGDSFNSVLINLYRDGNDSVAWHSDDEFELGDDPVIASVSLGAVRRFSLRHRFNKALGTVHLDLQPGSLLIMRGATQRYWQHQVAKVKTPTDARVNLTFRNIIRTR